MRTVNYYLKDAHGDVTALADAAGTITKNYFYDAFGNEQYTMADSNPFRYCGEYADRETGLLYLRNRYYDPSIGRFISEDPIQDGTNWYAYANNNPVMFIDPWGLEYLVISGGAYSTESHGGYKYNFIEPALKNIEYLGSLEGNENITWIIADEGWSDSDKDKFKKALSNMQTFIQNKLTLKMVSNKDELFSYINNKDGNNRSADPIRKVVVYSHGLANGTLSLGYNYSNNYNTSLNITLDDLNTNNIRASAFDNPNSMFYSCNTGTDVGGKWGNNFAQKWVNITGGKTWAFNGKTDYSVLPQNESYWIKISRFKNGFSFVGSANYPAPANQNVSLITFWR